MSEVDRKVAFTFTPSMWTGVCACRSVEVQVSGVERGVAAHGCAAAGVRRMCPLYSSCSGRFRCSAACLIYKFCFHLRVKAAEG